VMIIFDFCTRGLEQHCRRDLSTTITKIIDLKALVTNKRGCDDAMFYEHRFSGGTTLSVDK